MDPVLAQYPDIISQLDDSEAFENTAELSVDNAGRPVIVVTQTGPLTSGQAVFLVQDGSTRLVAADAVVNLDGPVLDMSLRAPCDRRSPDEHARVADTMHKLKDNYSSVTGPDRGNLACAWAVSHIVHEALGIWITRQVGTQGFAAELMACFEHGAEEHDLPDGAIIISPTGSGSGKLKHGHVGLLGEREGGDRYIYSNSSTHMRWERNWTLSAWKEHYGQSLKVLFFPLPTTGGSSTLIQSLTTSREEQRAFEPALVPLGLRWADVKGVEQLVGITFEQLKAEYRRLYDDLSIKPERLSKVDLAIDKIIATRPRYETVSMKTGVPWHVVAVIHLLEGSLNFGTHLHNGDPLIARTVQTPAGRPKTGEPPFTWEESAMDALSYDGLTTVKDWSIERTAYMLESFNGFGYRLYHPSVKSPYLWSYILRLFENPAPPPCQAGPSWTLPEP